MNTKREEKPRLPESKGWYSQSSIRRLGEVKPNKEDKEHWSFREELRTKAPKKERSAGKSKPAKAVNKKLQAILDLLLD